MDTERSWLAMKQASGEDKDLVLAKKGYVQVQGATKNIHLALARDDGRIYSRLGARWVDLTVEAAKAVIALLQAAVAAAEKTNSDTREAK